MSFPTLRLAGAGDAARILNIYAPFVNDTAISFEYAVPTPEEMEGRIARTQKAYPYIVCEAEGAVSGYAYAGRFRERPAYDFDVETSIYIDPAFHGRGIGSALYRALLSLLTLQRYVNAYAGITLPNEKSLALHRAFGFERVGVFHRAGYKLNAWHDVAFLEKALNPTQPPEPPIPFPALDARAVGDILAHSVIQK